MRTIVAGSRNIKNKKLIFEILDKHKDKITEIVCGEAVGLDNIGKEWGLKNNIPIKSFSAE